MQVTLEYVRDITGDGLFVFLSAISPNVVSLTIRGILDVKALRLHMKQLVLDDVVDKMRCLQELDISGESGDVASEIMLRRRSEVFLRSTVRVSRWFGYRSSSYRGFRTVPTGSGLGGSQTQKFACLLKGHLHGVPPLRLSED